MDMNEAQIETINRIRANSGTPTGEYGASEHDEGALVRFENGSGYVLDENGAIVAHADEEVEADTEAETEEAETEEADEPEAEEAQAETAVEE